MLARYVRTLYCEPTRKVDIAHSGQTVEEALDQLTREIAAARRGGDDALLVVHGYGASGAGGAIKLAIRQELVRLERLFSFKAYGETERDRVPESVRIDRRHLNAGSTLLVFRRATPNEFRPNFRELRRRVKVRRTRST